MNENQRVVLRRLCAAGPQSTRELIDYTELRTGQVHGALLALCADKFIEGQRSDPTGRFVWTATVAGIDQDAQIEPPQRSSRLNAYVRMEGVADDGQELFRMNCAVPGWTELDLRNHVQIERIALIRVLVQ